MAIIHRNGKISQRISMIDIYSRELIALKANRKNRNLVNANFHLKILHVLVYLPIHSCKNIY